MVLAWFAYLWEEKPMTEQSRRKRSDKVRKDTLPLTSKQIAEMEQRYPGFAQWYCTKQHQQERQAKKEAVDE